MPPNPEKPIEHRPSQIAFDLAVWLVGAYGDRAKEFRDYWAVAYLQHAQFVASFGDYCFEGEDTFVPGSPDQSNINQGMRRAFLAFKGMPDVTDEMIDGVIDEIARRKAKGKSQ